ncbi:unnamed protein product, partial [Meganyctiphanes norvegica]
MCVCVFGGHNLPPTCQSFQLESKDRSCTKTSSMHPRPSLLPRALPPSISTPRTCGISSNFDVGERIHNGRPSISGLYPWMVLFSFFSSFHERNLPCGGTLVSKRWVLTAAHCFRYI